MKPTFKKGDKVRYVNRKSWAVWPDWAEMATKGRPTEIYTIKNIDYDGNVVLREGRGYYCPSDQFIPADAGILVNKDEFDYLMKELEEIGYRWAVGQLPTEFDPFASEIYVGGVSGGSVLIGFENGFEKSNLIWKEELHFKEGRDLTFTEIYGNVITETASDTFKKEVITSTALGSDGQIYGADTVISTLEDYKLKDKTFMKTISDVFKRVVKKDIRDQYQVDYRNGDLELTEKGKNVLLELLATKYEKELADKAREEIAEIEKNK